jgi:glutamine phosphoribosylpyrophosphate amidotransferase
MSTYGELIAPRHFHGALGEPHREITGGEIAKIKQELGVDSLIYSHWDGLLRALQVEQNKLCMACLNGLYKTPGGLKRASDAWKKHLPTAVKPSPEPVNRV